MAADSKMVKKRTAEERRRYTEENGFNDNNTDIGSLPEIFELAHLRYDLLGKTTDKLLPRSSVESFADRLHPPLALSVRQILDTDKPLPRPLVRRGPNVGQTSPASTLCLEQRYRGVDAQRQYIYAELQCASPRAALDSHPRRPRTTAGNTTTPILVRGLGTSRYDSCLWLLRKCGTGAHRIPSRYIRPRAACMSSASSARSVQATCSFPYNLQRWTNM